MRYSNLFGQTLREAPADSPSAGLALLARAAYLRFPSTLLPLGLLSYNRLSELVVSRIENAGGTEISPGADPLSLAGSEIQSHRHLPRVLFCRNFPSIDVSILAESEGGRNKLGDNLLSGLGESFEKLNLTMVQADNGSLFSTTSNDTTLLKCPSCGYVETQELALRYAGSGPQESLLAIEKVLTPDCPTIESLARSLNVPESKTAKAILLMAYRGDKEEFHFVIVRGDTTLSLPKLAQVSGAVGFVPATEQQIRSAGAEPGYASPVGLQNVKVIVDQLIPISPNLVAGANEHGYHLRNTNYGRDYTATLVADIATAEAGDACPKCQSPLETLSAGLIARWDRFQPSPRSGVFTDEKGRPSPVWHGRINLEFFRLLVALAETHHDEKGLTLPSPVSPFDVYLVALPGKSLDIASAANKLYNELLSANVTTLYDDRDERAGVKFNDADLIGCPHRITLGERNLQNGMVEFKLRTSPDNQLIPINEVIPYIKSNG